uniref:Ima1_N domain-containing protein n=1 Tax=Elaeophora elaphi TaxID=1147741 RepID=A0A0R3RX54_9BILA
MVGDISLWSAGSIFLSIALIFYFIYRMVRPFCKVMVNCWFCNENIRISYCNRQAFICPKCGQYNGFKEDGDYDRFIPEQKYEFLNPAPKRKRTDNIKMNENRKSVTTSGLCQRCNVQQARIQSQINKFEPRNEANFDGEFEVYKTRLYKSYPLCDDCEQVVQRKLELDKVAFIYSTQLSFKVSSAHSLLLLQKFGLNQLHCSPIFTSHHRYRQLSQKHFSEISKASQRGPNHRRYRAALFNCGPISNCLNLLTFFTSCCLFITYLLQLQNSTTTYLFDLSQLLPCYVLSSWIPFLTFHTSKIILLGLGSHTTSLIIMHARRSLPDIVSFVIWCVLLFLKNSEGEKEELDLSQLSFVSILCIVSFAVAFFPRKLLHRKRPNSIIQSAFSIASTPVSQCSTLSAHTDKSVSFSGSVRDRAISSKESTPSRELGKLFDSLSLGDDLSSPKGTPILKQRRGPFDSMKKPILTEPRLRIRDTREGMFLDSIMRPPASRYVRSFAPSTMTSVSVTPHPSKFTLFNIICVLGTLMSLALNAFMFFKLFYATKS